MDNNTSGDDVDDPWLRFAGMWKDDPQWDLFQAEIESFRRSMDRPVDSEPLSDLEALDDEALWQAARTTMTIEQRDRLEELLEFKSSLTTEEEAEVRALVALYRKIILIRAEAAVLLKNRGYDVSDPGQFAPI
jgi:hypothetical protein